MRIRVPSATRPSSPNNCESLTGSIRAPVGPIRPVVVIVGPSDLSNATAEVAIIPMPDRQIMNHVVHRQRAGARAGAQGGSQSIQSDPVGAKIAISSPPRFSRPAAVEAGPDDRWPDTAYGWRTTCYGHLSPHERVLPLFFLGAGPATYENGRKIAQFDSQILARSHKALMWW